MRTPALCTALALAPLLAAGGCNGAAGTGAAGAPAPPTAPGPGGAAGATGSGEAQGSLRQDEITVEVVAGTVRIRLTPLDPEILRLTAPDTRRRLTSLSTAGGVAEGGDGGAAFLVSVFTEEPGGADFEPRAVTLENRGRVLRPVSIRGLTPGWGTRLVQRRAEQAVYTFSPELDLELPLVVEAAGARSDAWASILPRLDVERARIRTRGGGSAPPHPSRPNLRILR
ncbi:MAG: hypothetical protein RQ751_05805 [Longimicrobiales bacterium]|nr:hypothetical protein [Longimicrobiales bacterium]